MLRTHVIYQGNTTIAQLIRNGMRLWNEEADLRSRLSHYELKDLWKFAEESLRQDVEASADSYSLLIMGDTLVPKAWKQDTPFPYNGLFASSFYFIEAERFFRSNKIDEAWPSLVQAYYFLGMNSSSMTSFESAILSAETRHHNNSSEIRSIIVEILHSLQSNKSIKNATLARKKVVDLIFENERYKEIWIAYDNSIAEATKKTRDYTPQNRLFNRLATWHGPQSPYPEIAAAFAPFLQKRKN